MKVPRYLLSTVVAIATLAQHTAHAQVDRQTEIAVFWKTVMVRLKEGDADRLDRHVANMRKGATVPARVNIYLMYDRGSLRPVNDEDRSLAPNHFMNLAYQKDMARQTWRVTAFDNQNFGRASFSYEQGIEKTYLYDPMLFDGRVARTVKAYCGGHLCAQAEATRVLAAGPAQIEIRETHFDRSGKAAYTGMLLVSYGRGSGGVVTKEWSTSGKKTARFFADWP